MGELGENCKGTLNYYGYTVSSTINSISVSEYTLENTAHCLKYTIIRVLSVPLIPVFRLNMRVCGQSARIFAYSV